MKDEFLYTHRPPVRTAFKVQLAQRLSAIESEIPAVKRENHGMRSASISFGRKLAWLVPLLALMIALSVSTPVRAMAAAWIKNIAGFFVEECNDSPIAAITISEAATLTPNDLVVGIPMDTEVPTALSPTEYAVSTAPVPDILENPPFPLSLPAWIPDGFVLDQNAGIALSENWVILQWHHPDLSEIVLLVEKEYTGYVLPAGENSSEEIDLNGQPALLIRGCWNGQNQWDMDRQLSLDWEKDGHHYHLGYTQREPEHLEIKPITGDQDLIIQMLIRMAESVP